MVDLKEEEILGDAISTHWYYVTKGRVMRDILRGITAPTVLDVGAGSGVFAKQLLKTDDFQSAACIDPNYPQERSETHNGKPIHFQRGYNSAPCKLALMMDVLEHVDDDVGLLREYAAHIAPGGHIFITVPAFQFLWSAHDVFLEHRRRYSKKMLLDAVRAAGLEPVKTRFFFVSLLPVVAAIRLAKRALLKQGKLEPRSEMSLMPRPVNALLTLIHDIERLTLFRVNGVAGLSLLCLCRKK
jgi:SAM-dependent methyltransferase